MSSRKRVLVTGGNSFSGKFMVEELQKEREIDLFVTARSEVNLGNGITFLPCDLSKEDDVLKLIQDARPDEIYHIAGSSVNDFDVVLQSNVLLAKNIFSSLKKTENSSKVLLVGSAAEYGIIGENGNPVSETLPLRPVSWYGLTKSWQTELGQMVSRDGVNVVIARTFNIYGPGISERLFPGIVNKQIQEFKRGERANLEFGNLSGERDYIHIREVVGYYKLLMQKGKAGEVYNVGSGIGTSLKDFLHARMDEEGVSVSSVLENGEASGASARVSKIYADISKLLALE